MGTVLERRERKQPGVPCVCFGFQNGNPGLDVASEAAVARAGLPCYFALQLGPEAARSFLLFLGQAESTALEAWRRFVTKTGSLLR